MSEETTQASNEVTERTNVCHGGPLNGWTFKPTSENKTIFFRSKPYDRTEEKDDKGRTIWQYRKEAKGGPAR